MLYLFFCELEQFKQLWKYLYFKDEVDFTGRFSKGNHFDSVKSSIKIILFRVSVFSRLVISKLHFPRNFSFLSNLQFVCRDLSKVVSCFLTSVSVCVCVCVVVAAAAAKSLQSCPTLYNPIDSSPPGSPVPGILQARILEWVAISFLLLNHF